MWAGRRIRSTFLFPLLFLSLAGIGCHSATTGKDLLQTAYQTNKAQFRESLQEFEKPEPRDQSAPKDKEPPPQRSQESDRGKTTTSHRQGPVEDPAWWNRRLPPLPANATPPIKTASFQAYSSPPPPNVPPQSPSSAAGWHALPLSRAFQVGQPIPID